MIYGRQAATFKFIVDMDLEQVEKYSCLSLMFIY